MNYDETKAMGNEILQFGIDLTDWEKDFIQSALGQFKMRGWLSNSQQAVLQRIHDTRVGRHRESEKTRRVRDEGREDMPGRSSERRGWRERGYDED